MNSKISLNQVNQFLLLGVLVVGVLYFAREVLVPLTFAIFFAMLLSPVSGWLEKKGINKIIAALLSILLILIAVSSIGLVVYAQGKKFAQRSDEIVKKTQEFRHKAQEYISVKLNIPETRQNEMVKKQRASALQNSGNSIKVFIAGFAGIMAKSVIVLIFTFLFLLQRGKYESFFLQVSGSDNNPDEAKKLIGQVSTVAQSYLTGRVISVFIFLAMFTVGFLMAGLESAFLMAFIASLLTIIPYVGPILGGLIPFGIALVTADMNVALWTGFVVLIVNAIDNYFIEPYIIGGEVNISAFFTIFILFVGGIIWGIAGLILFLPMLAVAKIIFDAVPELKPYGYLIGDQQKGKTSKRLFDKIKKIFRK